MQKRVGDDRDRGSAHRRADAPRGRLRVHARMLAFRRWLRHPRSRWILAGGGTVVVAILAGGVALLLNGPAETAVAPSPSATPRASMTATPEPSAPPSSDETWTALVLPPYEPLAELTADETDGSGISATGGFTFRSLTSAPAVELAAGLVVEPPVELAVDPGPSTDMASVHPTTPLVENARYDVRLYDDGVLVGGWTFRTGGALHVTRRLPDDRSTGVPVDTGIEIEFDQAAVRGVEERWSIDPSVAGSFEVHGRTWVFVPDAPLAPSTLYTVTLAPGVEIVESENTLESEVRFAFETEGPQPASAAARIFFDEPLREALPDEPPVIPIDYWSGTQEGGTTSRPAVLYELPTIDAAMAAVRTLSVDRRWANLAANGGVDTGGLGQVGAWDVEVSLQDQGRYVRLPTGLAEGWYLLDVTQEGPPTQIVLQITHLSAYVQASETRTIAWINDLATGSPVSGAGLLLEDGELLGAADSAGLVDIATPDTLRDAEPGARTIFLVSADDGRRILTSVANGTWWWQGFSASQAWWTILDTDRAQYRRDDTVHAWGLIRARDDRSVPGGVELQLLPVEASGPPIVRTAITPSGRGTFVADLPLSGLPPGGYNVGLYVGDSLVTQTWITITEIRKPAFQIEVTTDRRVYLAGEEITADVRADFYDGSTAPGLRLRVDAGSGVEGGQGSDLTLDATGSAQLTYRATASSAWPESGSIYVEGADPEEGLSSGSANFVVFPSAAWVAGEATLDDDLVSVTGTLTSVDLEAAEAQEREGGWIEDPSGEPIAGRSVEIVATRINWIAVQTGTGYDFIEKRSVPVYRHEEQRVSLGTYTVTSGADGTFSFTLPVDPDPGGIELKVSATDGAGRRAETTVWAGGGSPPATYASYPYLEERSFCMAARRMADIGESVTLTVRGPDDEPSAEGRTLFIASQAGIQRTEVTTGAEFSMQFDEADVPNITVQAVRLTATGYVVLNEADVEVRPEAKAIDVQLTASSDRYAPGEDVAVNIRTTGPDGDPIAADVIVQAVDLKLFAMGAAHDADTRALMAPLRSGSLGAYASHAVPSPASDCGFGAATGGGEPRSDFRDVATFQRITTGADGTAVVRFEAPDDLTSWRTSAMAFGDGLESGSAAIDVPVGLPFFVDVTVAPEYLDGEQATLMVRAYGDGLAADDGVRFSVDAPSLGMEEATFEGAAFTRVPVELRELPLGDHEVTIAAERSGSDETLGDAVVRTIRVVPTRLRTLQTEWIAVEDRTTPPGGDGMTTYVVTDGGRAGLSATLQYLAWSTSARLDAQLAASIARGVLVEEFGFDESALPQQEPPLLDGQPANGLALLPYGSADVFLTARTALVAPERATPEYLRQALLAQLAAEPDREQAIVALAGLAGLGDDVRSQLQGLASDDLTLRERAWLGLGLLASGDEDAARAVEREILTAHGQRLGPWVRLNLGADTPEAAETAASVLLLAAGLRDPIASDLSRYLLENPSSDYLPALEQLGFARAAMQWLAPEEARFTWTVDGERHEETVTGGSAVTLRLTAAQRASLVIERVAGTVVVASSWDGAASYDELPADPSVTIERTVTPAERVPVDALVRVRLVVTFHGKPVAGCYAVTDLVPSGLAPMVASMAYWTSETNAEVIQPYEVEGNRVSWCVSTDKPSVALGYSARVVSAGTYRWEPAVVQSVAAPSIGASTPPASYAID